MSGSSSNKKESKSDVIEQYILDKKSLDTEDHTEGKLKRDMQAGTCLPIKKKKTSNRVIVGGCGTATSDTLLSDDALIAHARDMPTPNALSNGMSYTNGKIIDKNVLELQSSSSDEEINYDDSDGDTDDKTVPYYKSSSSEDEVEQVK